MDETERNQRHTQSYYGKGAQKGGIYNSPLVHQYIVGWPRTGFGEFNNSTQSMDVLHSFRTLRPPAFRKLMLWSIPEVRFGGCHRHPVLFWPKIEPLDIPGFWQKITWDVYDSPLKFPKALYFIFVQT